MVVASSVIVHDLNMGGSAVHPSEAYPSPVIDADAVLPGAIGLERLQPIAG
jgi:hypothetical protein